MYSVGFQRELIHIYNLKLIRNPLTNIIISHQINTHLKSNKSSFEAINCAPNILSNNNFDAQHNNSNNFFVLSKNRIPNV